MKKILFLLILSAVVIFAGSPFFTAYQLTNAYKEHDGATIAKTINYPKLTYSLKTQLTTRFSDTISEYPMIAKLGGNNLLKFGNEFINYTVDGAITADNIKFTVHNDGQLANISKQLAGAWAIASNKIDLNDIIKDLLIQRGDMQAVLKKQVEKLEQEQQIAGQAKSGTEGKPSFAYCGLNCFEIEGVVKGYPLTIQMEREGMIDWKITDIKLP